MYTYYAFIVYTYIIYFRGFKIFTYLKMLKTITLLKIEYVKSVHLKFQYCPLDHFNHS